MLYHLFQYFESIGADFPGLGLMHYLSFRAMMAAVTAVLVAMFAGKRIIRLLQRKQIGETVRDLGLEGQIQKKGTPTMGGIIIILSILSGVLLFCDLTNIYVILLLVSTLWCGAIGFAVYLDLLSQLPTAERGVDADVLLLYGADADPAKVLEKAAEMRASGLSVRAQRQEDAGHYGRVVRMGGD